MMGQPSGPGSARESYERKYSGRGLYWTARPSTTCLEVLRLMPPTRALRLLDIGCGEGRNSLFFARNGYVVDAFDVSGKGVEKAAGLADEAGLAMNLFVADLNEYRLSSSYDILFSTGTLHFSRPEVREEMFENYRQHTAVGGINAFSVFVSKPFIPPAPDADPEACHFRSGEIFTYYHDWLIEACGEEIFDCGSGGVPHRHAVNRLSARKPDAVDSSAAPLRGRRR
ncbi:methyltransferase domain-containing protein [Candidatus Fermentibacterales bacterium]|nr:methyltransferase domain-containing protein [Candidatus Fermentibacterales bacterium]